MSTITAHTSRPVGVALATALLAVIGLAGVLVGPYLIALGIWLADGRVGDARLLVLTSEVLIGTGSIALGIASFAAARALWRGQAWAWPAAAFIALTLLAGMALIALLDAWMAPYALVVALAALLLASLLPASVRRACGL